MGIPAILPYPMPLKSDLPKNKVLWKADPKRSVLLIHDMQQYFLSPYEQNQSPITELIENINALKKTCKDFEIPVVYTAQPGSQKLEDRALLQDFWGYGLEEAEEQTKIAASVAPDKKDIVLTKWRYSAFKRTDLLNMMQELGRNQLIICGIYAHIGCIVTACDAFMQDIEAFFVGDAVADFSLEQHHMAIKFAAGCCASVKSTALLLEELKSVQYPCSDEIDKDNIQKCTIESVRGQISELLGELLTEADDNDNLIYRGLDSIRIMSLAERWRSIRTDITFVKLAKEPTVSAWWKHLALPGSKAL